MVSTGEDAGDDPNGQSQAGVAALVARMRRDIADLERLVVDMPPHHAGGTRRGTEERLDDLRAALLRAEATARGGATDRSGT